MSSNYSPDYKSLFNTLKSIFTPYEENLRIVVDQPDTYYVDMLASRSGKQTRTDDRDFFLGAVQIREGYATFHFAGLPKLPELLDFIPSDFCALQAPDGNVSLVFKSVKKHQLVRLSNILHEYMDSHVLSFQNKNI